MCSLRQQCGDQRFVDVCTKVLVGVVKGDTDRSFNGYYMKQYDLQITDENQVLLISHVKRMGPTRAPPPGPALLVPEFCYLTGLTVNMRNDFTIMRDLATHTRLSPEQRENRLNRFVSKISKNASAQDALGRWGLSFENKMLNLTGRVLSAERIIHGARAVRGTTERTHKMVCACVSVLLNQVYLCICVCVCAVRVQPMGRGLSYLKACFIHHSVSILSKVIYHVLTVKKSSATPQALMTIATKIALQMNCKMGGELWSIEIPIFHPPPGTVIDTEVTRPEWCAVRMGSLTPTHYNVVYDSSGLKPDHMQRLTYKLCHLYYNWQGRPIDEEDGSVVVPVD
ncbi:hypothetical protein Q7C36_004122 [Tachysurus vachellii]|uniref:Piwi domain-containing protein n=1 Tax=Tachysurus vachellii TaxID=175792 RepID=A0AA88NHV2_TACVA|nr:hypothetical protein Q7C36_004122 [Tachysurus vachellii]